MAQVLELMQALLDDAEEEGEQQQKRAPPSSEQLNQLKLEINASKMAHNIAVEELPQLVFLAFLGLPQVGALLGLPKIGEQSAAFNQVNFIFKNCYLCISWILNRFNP